MLNRNLLLFLLTVLLACSSALPSEAQTVYITRTGEKYHRGTCQYLKRSKISVTLSEAKKQGYTACSVCTPPNTVTDKTQPAVSDQQQRNVVTTPTQKKSSTRQCSAMTKSGLRCKRTISSGTGKCWQHQ